MVLLIHCLLPNYQEFWQAACLRRAVQSTREFINLREPFTYFCGSWKASYLAVMRDIHGAGSTSILAPQYTRTRGVSIFSDVLYRPHELAHKPSACTVSKGPPSSICTRIKPDADASLDAATFSLIYESGTGKPVIIEATEASTCNNGKSSDGNSSDNAIGSSSTNSSSNSSSSSSSNSNSSAWGDESMCGRFGDHVFHASGVNFKLRDYFTYALTNKVSNNIFLSYLFTPLSHLCSYTL